jgi:hypothetical protein
MNAQTRDSCRDIFKNLKILPMYSQYIYSLILFVVNNKDLFKSNHKIHTAILDIVQICTFLYSV